DGLGDVDLLHLLLDRRDEVRRTAVAAIAAACTAARRAPTGAGTARGSVGAALDRALLGRVVGPAGRQFLGLDRLLVAGLGSRGRSGRSGRRGGLVDGALDAFLARFGLGGFLGLLGRQHLLGLRHHGADRGGLFLGRLAALGQVGRALLLLVDHVGGLD